MRRSNRSLAFLAVLGLALAPLPAAASLIGDTITVRQGFITLGGTDFFQQNSTDIVVAAGTSDVTSVHNVFDHPFDAEAFSFMIDAGNTSWGMPFEFNGYRVEGLDFVGEPDRVITGVGFTSNIPGFSADRITFDDHAVYVDLQALVSPILTVTLETSVVPEPAPALLLGAGLLALGAGRCWPHQGSTQGRRSSSWVQALRGWRCSIQ